MKPHISLSILFLVISFFTTNAQNQKKLDSLINIYKTQKEDTIKVKTIVNLWKLTINNNPNKAEKYANEIIELSKKLNFDVGLAKGYQNLGISNLYLGNNDKSTRAYLDAIEIYKKLDYKDLIGSMYFNIGLNHKDLTQYDSAFYYNKLAENIFVEINDSIRLGSVHDQNSGLYLERGYHRLALQNALKAIKIFSKFGDSLRYADASTKIADSYTAIGDTLKAKKYYLEASSIYKEKNDLIFLSQISTKLGILLTKNLNTRDSAFTFLNKALELGKTTGSPWYQNHTMTALGDYYLTTKEYELAKKTFSKSLIIAKSNDYTFFEATSLIDLGKVDFFLNNYNSSIKNIRAGLKISKEKGITENINRANLSLSNTYEKMNQPSVALEYYKKYKKLNDNILNLEKSRQVEELKTIYETEKKEQQIALQENEIDLLEQKEKVSKLQKSLLGGGLLLSLGIVGFGFYGFSQRTKKNKLEKEKVDAELAFKKKELTTHALHLAKKNEVLEGLKLKAEELKTLENRNNGYQQLISTIDFDLKDDNNWENFSKYFQEVHTNFNKNVKQKFPEVTSNELRLMALLKMNLSSKEIANILNISQEGIKKARYRLRKKLNISTEDSLQDLVLKL